METTIKRKIKVDRHEISYLRYTIESYDGMAVVRTVDPQEAVLELQIAPGCEALVYALIREIRDNERVRITLI